MPANWERIAEAKRQAVNDLIPNEWRLENVPDVLTRKDITGDFARDFLEPKEIEITETDAVELAKKIAQHQWTAVEVTQAFCHRAAIAHQLIFFDAALEQARLLDQYLHEHGQTRGPLHGVPVSLKDQFHVKGVETHMGYVGWVGTFEGRAGDPRRGVFESEMVRELRECGAVLYCKTSVPHTLMSGETVNNIIGYTWNPKNRHLSAGGSSGGEGALIGFRGSPLGLGTDIGGSIRIPAGFNGLYGLRPSSGRLPYEGMANSMDGQTSVPSVVGPLATSAGGIRLLFQSILSIQPWLYDPLVDHLPWRTDEEQAIFDILKTGSGQQLAFGVYAHDGVVTPNPPVARAVAMVVAVLRQAGHRVIEWTDPLYEHGNSLILKAWQYDGGTDVHGAFGLAGEPVSPQVAELYGKEITTIATAVDIAANNRALREWRKSHGDLWNDTKNHTGTGRPIDAIISPLAPFPAARPGTYKYYGYSMWVNGLDYTSFVVPVTTADKAVDHYPPDYHVLNDQDRLSFDSYDADIFDGAHVSLQLVGRRQTEERMIAIGEYISSLLGR